MGVWNPWQGCLKYSEGCLHCYIHKGALKRGLDPTNIHKTKDFYKPIETDKDGNYKMKAGFQYLCFQSDFFLKEADEYRKECLEMIEKRQDIDFLFLTKRILRFDECIDDITKYPNLIISTTVENQEKADERLSYFKTLPIKRKIITCQPLLGPIDLEKYLDGISEVVVGGEMDKEGRVMDYDWVLSIREQCIRQNVSFTFRQVASNFKKDGKIYKINPFMLSKQAKLANIDYKRK